MDESAEKTKDLVQLARLALVGRPQDVQAYILRMSRKYKAGTPELAEELGLLIQHSPTRQSPLRGETVAAIPVDADTRLHLLRHEVIADLEHEPIWLPEIRRSLTQLVAEHSRVDDLLRAGLSPTRTALFVGPPGVGKTLAARWLARELGRPLLTLDLSAVMSSFLGRTGANLRHVLDYAKGVPCVMLLDEIDAMAKRRDDSQEVGELKRLVTVLLQEIDDWPSGGVLIAATNHSELLDPAVWRRFEMQVAFQLPAAGTVRQAVIEFLGKGVTCSERWLDVLAEVLSGKSFNDIERELMLVRRQAVVEGKELETLLPAVVRQYSVDMTKPARKELATKLAAAGMPQRQVNDVTGVSRDTIRKALHSNGDDHATIGN